LLVRAVHLVHFRNLVDQLLEPGPGFNVLSGDNGQGKTNLLEAIYLAGTLRSFRTSAAQEMIQLGQREAIVKARVERRGLERVYEISLGARRKQAKLDGKTPRALSEYFGDFNVVLFTPEDLRVPRGSPSGRRRFLDRSVFNREVTFLQDAQRYGRVLKSRNALLRDGSPRGDLLDVYDEQLAQLGARIVAARRRWLGELTRRFTSAYDTITQSGLAADLEYDASPEVLEAGVDVTAIASALALEIAAGRARDLARRQSNVGPHLHDVTWKLDGQPAAAFASQGQLRALVLAWKTAEMNLLTEAQGDAPVLLLDDVSSELDPSRNEFLFRFLTSSERQCFVTTTHPRHVPITENRVDFRVVAGAIDR
jgi:DNA replication and repair protein RecF